jgi:hypothetical protein
MQRFSLDRGRFAGPPRRGFPHPSGGSPSPSKSPPEGGDPTPKGRGRAAPLSALRAPLRPPGAPLRGSPGFAGSPSCPCSAMKGVGKRSAQGRQPRRGVGKKSKLRRRSRPQAASGGNVGKARQSVGRGGDSRWAAPGLSTGCPHPCPRTGVAARRSRSDLHISTARGSNSAPSGGLFCPAGLTTSVQEV